ncbi:MAG: peptidase [Polaromonas sp.]|nr:peptidase [Polaromonas sp.]
MTKPAAKPLHIFKPGRWTTMSGETIDFSAADLQATAAAFNPSLSKAPIVIGHPATDDPAQGWIAQLKATERGLFGTPDQVDPAFAEAANAGRYGALSAKFYRPTDPSNPVPGVWYLKHVGALGAQNPAVKGLDDPAFAGAEDDGCVCFQEGMAFSEWDDVTNASLWRRMRDWLIGDKGQAVADAVIPGFMVQDLEQAAQDEIREAALESAAIPAPAFSDPHHSLENTVTPAEKAALEAKSAATEAENTRLKAQLAQHQANQAQALADQAHAAHVAFCEGLAAQAKLLPAQHAVALATLDHLAAQSAPVQFGEGDAKAPLLDGFKAFLTAQPAQVSFGEHATNQRAGAAVDLGDPEAIASAATRYQTQSEADGTPVPYAHAVAHVVSGGRR